MFQAEILRQDGSKIVRDMTETPTAHGVRLTLAAALAPHYGLRGVWTAMAVELTFRGAIFLLRLFRGGWQNSITKQS